MALAAAESQIVMPHSIHPRLLALLVASLALGACTSSRSHSDTGEHDVYVPVNVEDAIAQLDSLLTQNQIDEIRAIESEQDFAGMTHHSLGAWLRNYWGLWRGSRMSTYFNERSIYHPDTMSWITLVSYYRHLQGEPIRLQDQLENAREDPIDFG